MKLFWFCRIGSSDSFSRVSKNILPELYKNGVELYTSINPMNLKDFEETKHLFKEYIIMGSLITLDKDPLVTMSFKDFQNINKNINDIGQMMKFSLLQTVYYCYHNNIDRLMITMGNYELNWFMKNIKHIREHASFLLKNIKIVIYSPFDHLPSNDAIMYYDQADTVITTIPYLLDSSYKVVGHGNDTVFKRYPKECRKTIINLLNKLKDTKIDYDDIIILNANFYSERKRIEATVDAFNIFCSNNKDKKYKLWLHNGGKLPKNINKIPKDNLIITGPCSSNELNMIYNVCKYGLQTSWGEGWSLTNCEHAICGGIQIVPDFLATGYHFKDSRGILIKVNHSIQKNEDSKEITVGITNIKDIVESLEIAINLPDPEEIYNNFKNYFNYTWETETQKLIKILLNK